MTHEVHQCSFSFVSGHQCNADVSVNRPSEHGVSSSEEHDSDSYIHIISHYAPEILNIWDLDLGLLLFLLKNVVEIIAPRFVHSNE